MQNKFADFKLHKYLKMHPLSIFKNYLIVESFRFSIKMKITFIQKHYVHKKCLNDHLYRRDAIVMRH